MKSLGTKVIRGSMGTSSTSIGGDRKRIQLFDGRYDTGYRVKEFKIWALDTECHAVLKTEPEYTLPMMNANDNTQIAWASAPGSGVGPLDDGIVDYDNIVVEDLFIQGYATTASQPWNYMIVLEKLQIGLTAGAYTMVRNTSQDTSSV